jgi:hypothetical protein
MPGERATSPAAVAPSEQFALTFELSVDNDEGPTEGNIASATFTVTG